LYAHGINLGDRPGLAPGHYEIVGHIVHEGRVIGMEVRLEGSGGIVIVLIV
jgi:hypothetical protein